MTAIDDIGEAGRQKHNDVVFSLVKVAAEPTGQDNQLLIDAGVYRFSRAGNSLCNLRFYGFTGSYHNRLLSCVQLTQ
jgi:hypothetical protein